jgi:hypothetical protein
MIPCACDTHKATRAARLSASALRTDQATITLLSYRVVACLVATHTHTHTHTHTDVHTHATDLSVVVDDADDAVGGDLEGLVMRAVLLSLLCHQAHVADVAHLGHVELAMCPARGRCNRCT